MHEGEDAAAAAAVDCFSFVPEEAAFFFSSYKHPQSLQQLSQRQTKKCLSIVLFLRILETASIIPTS